MEYSDYKWVCHGFYFETENEYKLALKDEERYLYVMEQVEHNQDKTILIEVFNKLNESGKFKTVVGMSYLKELYNYILVEGIATEEELLPIEGFTVSKLHSASGYSYAQLNKMKGQMEQRVKEKINSYKNKMYSLKIVICVLTVLVATLFYLGINRNTASNYASAKESVIDEYATWESELLEKEKELKEKEEKLNSMVKNIEEKEKTTEEDGEKY